MFLGLIAWKVIVDPRGKQEPLATISGALRKVIQKKDPKLLHESKWDQFNDEEKLTEVLHHVIKISDEP